MALKKQSFQKKAEASRVLLRIYFKSENVQVPRMIYVYLYAYRYIMLLRFF